MLLIKIPNKSRQTLTASRPRFVIFGSLFMFVAASLFMATLCSVRDSYAASTNITANLSDVISMSVTENYINLELIPSSLGASTYGSTTIDVATNSPNGYQLMMSVSSTSINSATGGQGKINSISGATTSSPQALALNTWGWYSDNLGAFNNQYVSLPNLGSEQLIRETDSNSTSSTTVVTFGVEIGMDLPADTYTDTVFFTAISNYIPPSEPAPSLISASQSNANDVYPTTGWGGNTISITSNGQFQNVTAVTVGGTDCLSYLVDSTNLIRCVLPSLAANDTGYDISVTADGTSVDLSGIKVRYINPARTIVTGSTATSNNTMQAFTAENCSAMTVGQMVTLTDSRNNQAYRIKKMPDNKCWTIDNLKYAGEGSTTLANSDGTYGLVFNNSVSTYNTQTGQSTPYSSSNYDKAFYNNPASQSYCHDSGIADSYTGCGFFYNWYAATAGTGIYDMPAPNTNASDSICPTGWSLPSGTSDGTTPTGTGGSYAAADYPVLNSSMYAGTLTTGTYTSEGYYQNWQFNSPWEAVFAGQFRNNFIDSSQTSLYWTSTAYESTDGTKSSARTLTVTNNLVAPGSDFAIKPSGLAVRCVMRTSN